MERMGPWHEAGQFYERSFPSVVRSTEGDFSAAYVIHRGFHTLSLTVWRFFRSSPFRFRVGVLASQPRSAQPVTVKFPLPLGFCAEATSQDTLRGMAVFDRDTPHVL